MPPRFAAPSRLVKRAPPTGAASALSTVAAVTDLWAPGTATGVGSMPGTEPIEAVRLVFEAFPDLPHLPELPERGLGAQMTGRAVALLVDMPVDMQPSGWRLVDRVGADLRRARSMLAQDLDALEEVADGYEGPLKLQVTGPWTLAATVEKYRGDRALSDHGARRELAASLTEGLRRHVAEVARRIPGSRVLLQLDEPALPTVLAGGVPTVSGFGRLRTIEEAEARRVLQAVVDAVEAPVLVHCCAASPPVDLFRTAGAAGVSVDMTLLDVDRDEELEPIAAAVEAGLVLLAGVVPSAPERPSLSEVVGSVGATRRRMATLWRRLGQPADELAARVAITPTCGLGGASLAYAGAALGRARDVARALHEQPEE